MLKDFVIRQFINMGRIVFLGKAHIIGCGLYSGLCVYTWQCGIVIWINALKSACFIATQAIGLNVNYNIFTYYADILVTDAYNLAWKNCSIADYIFCYTTYRKNVQALFICMPDKSFKNTTQWMSLCEMNLIWCWKL